MRQRGRKSPDNVVSLIVDGSPRRINAPAYLSKPERMLFDQIVNACAPAHFALADVTLLASYVQASLIAQDTARDPGKVTEWEKAVRVQAMLATKLRLSPQSRTDPKTIARNLPAKELPPWAR